MENEIINWLLEGPAWLKYAVETQLLDSTPSVQPVLEDDGIRKLISRLRDEKVGIPAIKTGAVKFSETGNAYWDLFFLADIGLCVDDLGLHEEIKDFFTLQLPDATFITEENHEPNYFCVSAIFLSSVARIGYKHDPRVRKYIQHFLDTQRLDGGWHCEEKRAPGNELENTESCPMDNLNILMMLGQYDEYRNDPRFDGAIDLLLHHWDRRTERLRLYEFGIGPRYRKIEYPSVKYGVMRVIEALSQFPHAARDERFNDMLDFVRSRSSHGRYSSESTFDAYSDFDFGHAGTPSRWLTFILKRIEKRAGENVQ